MSSPADIVGPSQSTGGKPSRPAARWIASVHRARLLKCFFRTSIRPTTGKFFSVHASTTAPPWMRHCAVVRTRHDLAGVRVAATSRLSALLEVHWPGARAIFADVDFRISQQFLPVTQPRQ